MSKNIFSKKVQLRFVVGLSAFALMACGSNSTNTANNAETTTVTTETTSTAASENTYQPEFDRLVARGDIQVSGYTTSGIMEYNDDTLHLLTGNTQFLRNGDEVTFALTDKYVEQLKKEGENLSGDNQFTYKVTNLKEVGKINNMDKLYQTLKGRLNSNVNYEIVADNRLRLFTSSKDQEQLDRIKPDIIVKTTETDNTNRVHVAHFVVTYSIKLNNQDLSTLINDTLLETAASIEPSSEVSPERESGLALFITNLNMTAEEVNNWLKNTHYLSYHE